VSTAQIGEQDRPRIPVVDSPTEEQAEALRRSALVRDGEPLNIFKTLAHHPRLLSGMTRLADVFFRGELSARDRELAILRTGARLGCAYELAQHIPFGLAVGLEQREIDAICGLEAHHLGARDEAILAAVDGLLTHDTIDDDAWAGLSAMYSRPQILELIFLVGFYRMLAGFLVSVRVAIEPNAFELPLFPPSTPAAT